MKNRELGLEKPVKKSMKKKIALLLAVAMLFSMLPMNVFGATGRVPSNPLTLTAGSTTTFSFLLQFPVSDYYGSTKVSQSALLTLSSGDGKIEFDYDSMPMSVFSSGFTLTSSGAQDAILFLKEEYFNSYDNFTTNSGKQIINVPVTVSIANLAAGKSAVLDVVPRAYAGQSGVSEATFTIATRPSDVKNLATITFGTPKEENNTFALDTIMVTENQAGAFGDGTTTQVTLTFTAPQHYEWTTKGSVVANLGRMTITGANPSLASADSTNKNVLIFTFNIEKKSDIPDALEITGLELYAKSDAPSTGDVSVTVKYSDDGIDGDEKSAAAVVAKRIQPGLHYERVDNAPAEAWAGRGGQKSAWITLYEDAPGSWDTSGSNETTFTVPDGVTIESINIYEKDGADAFTEVPGSQENRTGLHSSGQINVESNKVTLKLGKNDSTKRGGIVMQIVFNTKLGYEGDIELTIGGRAVYGLDSSLNLVGKKLTIATVSNPLSIEIEEVIEVERNANSVYEPFSVTITEETADLFKYGNKIYMYVEGRSRDDIVLDYSNVAYSFEGSVRGEIIGTVSPASLGGTSDDPKAGLVFEVRGEPKSNEIDSITIDGIIVDGWSNAGFSAASNLVIRVGGSDWKENDYKELLIQPVNPDTTPEPEPEEGPEVEPEVPSHPSYEMIFNTARFTDDEGRWINGVYFSVFQIIDSIGYVMASELADVLGLEYSFVNNIVWVDGQVRGQATFEGYDQDGNYRVVTFADESNVMTIAIGPDRANVGPARPANVKASAGDVPAINDGGKFYVPVRAFQDAFGVTVTWHDATRSVYLNSLPY